VVVRVSGGGGEGVGAGLGMRGLRLRSGPSVSPRGVGGRIAAPCWGRGDVAAANNPAAYQNLVFCKPPRTGRSGGRKAACVWRLTLAARQRSAVGRRAAPERVRRSSPQGAPSQRPDPQARG